jgi:predicted NBD/HSP70 family sugar kinase
LKESWVCESSTVTSIRGRRPTLIRLNESLVALALDIHPRQVTIAVVDLNGRLIRRSMAPLTRDPAASTERMLVELKRVRAELGGLSIEGIGISFPGRVDPKTDRCLFAPNLQWHGFDLKAAIEQGMRLPIQIANAAIACLWAELTFHPHEGVRDAVLVTVSEGVGAAVLANGSIVTGHDGMAGEFGHICLDPAGPECACGRRGCWEVFASCRAALRYFNQLERESRELSFGELLSLAEDGHVHAGQALATQARQIGQGLRLIMAALAPSIIYIAGDVTSAWHRYGPVLEEAARQLIIAGTPPRVVPTRDGDLARLRGAAALVFQGAKRT